MSYAILIDAGFLKRKLGSKQSPATAKNVSEFVDKIKRIEILQSEKLHRVYYYDSPPLKKQTTKPLNGGQIDFGKRKTLVNL